MLYIPHVAESVVETLDEVLQYLTTEYYREYAVSFLEDFNATLIRLQKYAGTKKLHHIPFLASLGYREIRFERHDWYLLYTINGNIAEVKILANDKQAVEKLIDNIN